MVTDNDLTRWSEDYKQCLNTPGVRYRLVDRPGHFLGYVAVSQATGRVTWSGLEHTERGTIEFKYRDGRTAHYVSFFPGINGRTIVFDPSYSTQHSGGFNLDRWMRNGMNRIFGVNQYDMFHQQTPVQLYNTVLQESDDGWCQSWSLAMLHPVLQNDVQGWAMEPDADLHSRRPQAHQVVQTFADDLLQPDFLYALGVTAGEAAWRRHVRVLPTLPYNWWRMYTNAARTRCTPNNRNVFPAWRRDQPPSPRTLNFGTGPAHAD